MLLGTDGRSSDTGKIAGGGLLTAMILIFILFSYLSPTADLALMSCASLGIAIAVVRYGYKTAIVVLLASSFISAIWPGVFFSLPFLILFGPWPLLKALIEKRNSKLAVVLLKQLAATILLLLAAMVYMLIFQVDPRELLKLELIAGMPELVVWLIAIAAAELVFYLYDWALTILITIYMRRLNGRI